MFDMCYGPQSPCTDLGILLCHVQWFSTYSRLLSDYMRRDKGIGMDLTLVHTPLFPCCAAANGLPGTVLSSILPGSAHFKRGDCLARVWPVWNQVGISTCSTCSDVIQTRSSHRSFFYGPPSSQLASCMQHPQMHIVRFNIVWAIRCSSRTT